MTEYLTAIFVEKSNMFNTWMEDEKIVRMLMPAALLKGARGRKDIRRKLREEKKEMKTRHRFPKTWGGARTTSLTFDRVEHMEIKRLVEKGVMWEGAQRHIQIIDTNKMGEFKHSLLP